MLPNLWQLLEGFAFIVLLVSGAVVMTMLGSDPPKNEPARVGPVLRRCPYCKGHKFDPHGCTSCGCPSDLC